MQLIGGTLAISRKSAVEFSLVGLPRLGYTPRLSSTGVPGYTIAEAGALLGCSDGKVRGIYERTFVDGSGTRLCEAEDVDRRRAELLARLGATEPGEGVIDVERVRRLEEKLRLLLAARAAARDSERNALAAEEAYLDAVLADLPLSM
jgi:hypothetical protein